MEKTDINLQQLLEYDKENKVLSKSEFKKLKNFLNSIKFRNYENYRSNLPIHKELKKTYEKFLSDLLNEINLSTIDNDPLSIIILVAYYLIPNGILSITKKFHLIDSGIYKIDYDYRSYVTKDLLGTYIASGYGSCRHFNSFISDLIKIKGLKSDKITCIFGNINDYNETKKNLIYTHNNHVISGFIYQNNYYLIDALWNKYNLIETEEYFYNDSNFYILDFLYNDIQKDLNWNPYIPYKTFGENEIIEKRNKIYTILKNGEFKRFEKFKINHLKDLYKIHTLSLLEIERTTLKENQKAKKYGK